MILLTNPSENIFRILLSVELESLVYIL